MLLLEDKKRYVPHRASHYHYNIAFPEIRSSRGKMDTNFRTSVRNLSHKLKDEKNTDLEKYIIYVALGAILAKYVETKITTLVDEKLSQAFKVKL